MTGAVAAYQARIDELLHEIARTQGEQIQAAARLIADCLANDKLIHVFGTGGHSNMAAEEMFYRSGGLVPVNAILDPGVSLAFGAVRSTVIERAPGYAPRVLDVYGVGPGDVLVVVNAYGINGTTIDAAIEGKRRGASVIAITSPTFTKHIPPDHPARHPSKKNLFELPEVDVCIDCHMPVGDAVLQLEGMGGTPVGPCSTIVNAFCINSMVVAAVELMLSRGQTPPVWYSANMPGGDEKNKAAIANYRGRLRHL
ncbi:MAG: SIS domain-containing protein [Armatimonadota bacterium]|nr:SIS domain-containing protein [Armatimonadota bacterium]